MTPAKTTQSHRQVGLSTTLDLAKQRPIQLILGIIFTTIPITAVAILFFVSGLLNSQVPPVDYDLISSDGAIAIATITAMELNENITVNNQHPTIISYQYLNGNRQVENRFRTLNPAMTDRLQVGDKIEIRHLDGSSIIVGLEPFKFPYGMFAIILSPFLVFGLVNLGFLYANVRKMIHLYRHGEVWDATIIVMTPRTGMPVSGIGAGVNVHYQYKTSAGKPALGESITNDFSILSSKKQGDTIKIFVSPEDETKSCIIPKLDEVRNGWGNLST